MLTTLIPLALRDRWGEPSSKRVFRVALCATLWTRRVSARTRQPKKCRGQTERSFAAELNCS